MVADLTPLRGMSLTHLDCRTTKVSDLSPLRGMPLKALWCDFNLERDAEILRSLKTLELINGKPAKEFWNTASNGAKADPDRRAAGWIWSIDGALSSW
jgi:hypothetical protein